MSCKLAKILFLLPFLFLVDPNNKFYVASPCLIKFKCPKYELPIWYHDSVVHVRSPTQVIHLMWQSCVVFLVLKKQYNSMFPFHKEKKNKRKDEKRRKSNKVKKMWSTWMRNMIFFFNHRIAPCEVSKFLSRCQWLSLFVIIC